MPWRLLGSASDADLRRLIAAARRRRFRQGEVVFHEGDPADSLHLIEAGRFLISVIAPRGNTTALAVHGPGDTFGEMALVSDDTVRSATVAALEASETWAVYRTDFHQLRTSDPAIDDVLVRLLADRVRIMNDRLVEALYHDADTRVRRRLRDLAVVYGHGGESETVIPLTQERLAELAGTSRATVNRVLRHDAARGDLRLRRGRIVIPLTSRAAPQQP